MFKMFFFLSQIFARLPENLICNFLHDLMVLCHGMCSNKIYYFVLLSSCKSTSLCLNMTHLKSFYPAIENTMPIQDTSGYRPPTKKLHSLQWRVCRAHIFYNGWMIHKHSWLISLLSSIWLITSTAYVMLQYS